jgi:hypothetical protein
MASGFINDSNQLQAEMYKVIITMSNTTYYPTADGNDNGGVTPNTADGFTSLPTTLVLGKARARGNMRFRNIVNRLTGLGDCQLRDITITESNGDAQATSLQFTVNFERPAFVLASYINQQKASGATLSTGTVTIDGQVIPTYYALDGSTAVNTTAIALKNVVAQGIRDVTTATMRVYDPTLPGDTQASITVTTTGATASQSYGTVAVTLIDESTLFD